MNKIRMQLNLPLNPRRRTQILCSYTPLTRYAIRCDLTIRYVGTTWRSLFGEARIVDGQVESSSATVLETNTFGVATQFRETRVTRAWEIFRNTEWVRGATGRHDGFVRMVRRVRTIPTGRRNKILLKLIRALGHVCKESRQRRRRRRRGRRDSPPKVDRTVWALYFNEFWYFDTFPTSCYALPRATAPSFCPFFSAIFTAPLLLSYIRIIARLESLAEIYGNFLSSSKQSEDLNKLMKLYNLIVRYTWNIILTLRVYIRD